MLRLRDGYGYQNSGRGGQRSEISPKGISPFRQVRLQAGNTLIKLIDIELPPEPVFNEFNPGVRWLTIFVEDVHETVKDLKQNGVTFLAESIAAPDAAGVVCAEDPDGVLIEFVQV